MNFITFEGGLGDLGGSQIPKSMKHGATIDSEKPIVLNPFLNLRAFLVWIISISLSEGFGSVLGLQDPLS